MSGTGDLDEIIRDRLLDIYACVPDVLALGLSRLIKTASDSSDSKKRKGRTAEQVLWDQRDCVLITYADQISDASGSPLTALGRFVRDYDLADLTNTIHLLPFFPWTSDDGFSVADYGQVHPEYGSWQDIESLGDDVDLMFDLVLNHCSASHHWFQEFLRNRPPYRDFFIDVDPTTDLSQVVRPRSLPLLTRYETTAGVKHVWTTFSDDQVDLNYQDPVLMLEMLTALVDYARRGARIIRLDAIAYLWKEIGTSCVHLRQSHAVVKLMRRLLDLTVPGTLVLTETNVPHAENMSYFGDGDEAHVVYQFSLPPLMLDAIHSGDASVLTGWLSDLKPPHPQTTFLNFTASHDGIGVRPLEGLVSDVRLNTLVETVRRHGGAVSMRRNSDGSDSPYELNITYMDAVADASKVTPQEHARRFLGTQAIMLALRGLPAIYFHSLVGSPNDIDGIRETGRNRSINRYKYHRDDLDALLGNDQESQSVRMRTVFQGYWKLLKIRRDLSAMHPDASQRVLEFEQPGLFGFVRGENPGTEHQLTVVANFSDEMRYVRIPPTKAGHFLDHLSAVLNPDQAVIEILDAEMEMPLSPYQVRWLSNH